MATSKTFLLHILFTKCITLWNIHVSILTGMFNVRYTIELG